MIPVDCLEDADRKSLERLATFLKMKINPAWDKKKLAIMLSLEINPPPPSMY